MKKSNITAIALYAALMSTTGFAFAGATTSTDCGTSPSCISMGDATSKDNTVSQVNPTTASNGNDLSNGNTVKTNITGGNTTSTGGTTTSTGGTNTATGGTYTTGALNAGGATVGNTDNASSAETGSNSSVTNVDAADRSTTNYRSVALVLPSVGVTAPSTVAVGNIIKETMACGVLQSVQRDTVKGTYLGLFKRSQIDLGTDDSLVPFTNETGEEVYYKRVLGSDGKYRLMGHQPIIYTTVLSVSGARNLSLGGGGSQQEWGQAGVGASSAMNRLVSKIQLRSCEMAVEQVPTVARIKQ